MCFLEAIRQELFYIKSFFNFFMRNSQENTCATVFPGPILISKGSVRYIQKGHPNMAAQADMILQN